MSNISGGQLAAEALIEREVQYVFTLSGGHITPIYQYLEKSPVTFSIPGTSRPPYSWPKPTAG